MDDTAEVLDLVLCPVKQHQAWRGQDGGVTVPAATPSSLGVDAQGLLAVLDALEAHPAIEPHGIIVQRHGHRIAEGAWAPHRTDRARLSYSVSKTFTGVALGLQIGEGRLGLDDLVCDHLPEETIDADDRTRRMRIRHLASMSTGHDHDTVLDAIVANPRDPLRGFLALPPEHEPGTWFAYNQPPVLALSTILTRLAGSPLVEYLRPRLLDPLGIGDLRWAQAAPGVEMGFSGVFATLDAVARLGQLHLDAGRWNGRQVLPEGWVAEASRPHVANPRELTVDWRQGYGLLTWMSRHGFRGDGAFGQLMVVLPEHGTVVAVFANTDDMQAELDILWDHLLPALGPDARPGTGADDRLAERLAGLALPTAAQRSNGEVAVPPTGEYRPGVTGAMSHPTVTSVEVDGDRMVLREGDRRLTVPLDGSWVTVDDPPVSASTARTRSGAYVADLAFLASPHRLEVTLDPTSRTFDATWPSFPLFGAGLGAVLSDMRAPTLESSDDDPGRT